VRTLHHAKKKFGKKLVVPMTIEEVSKRLQKIKDRIKLNDAIKT
jgi:uncharacterized protein YlzI (FlbEa/FlbD family)